MASRIIPCVNCNSVSHRELVTTDVRVVVCNRCGLIFQNPQHEEADYIRFYESSYRDKIKQFSKTAKEILTLKRDQRAYLKFLLLNLPNDRSMAVLDVGCGLGAFMQFMKESGFSNVWGLDPEKGLDDFVRSRFGLRVHEEGLFANSLKLASYDLLLSIANIEHYTNPKAAFLAMRKLLRNDGYLYVNTIDTRTMVLRKGINKYFKFVHTYYFTENSLKSLLGQAGFSVIQSWTSPPVFDYSTLIRPENFLHGRLNILAKKDRVPNEIYLKDDPESVVDSFEKAYKRDWVYAKIHHFLNYSRLGYPFNVLRSYLA